MATKTPKKSFSEALLTKGERQQYQDANNRINFLKESRRDIYGIDLDALWVEAQQAYIPHRFKTHEGTKAIVTDEEKGLRGAIVNLQSADDWQADFASANPMIKIMIAVSILVDQNPTGTFVAGSSRYEKANLLVKHLYQKNWELAMSKEQLKLYIFNLCMFGWAAARTYPLKKTRKVKILTEYSEDNPIYEEKEAVEYNDVYRENLDPRNVWVDEKAKPLTPMSQDDWAWRKVYTRAEAEQAFGKTKLWEYVKNGGDTSETSGSKSEKDKFDEKQGLIEAYFYESLSKDLFMAQLNGVPVIIEPLPIATVAGVKKLSCWHNPFYLRSAECPYGIGIYEAMRFDNGIYDRIRNMTLDQLVLSIYKMFFYQGTNTLTEDGTIKIAPGKGKQVLNPKDINWLEVPGPGREAWEGIAQYKKDVDESSGITDPLMGNITGKTAFELAQAKESALKRLKTPLDNICYSLEVDAHITVCLQQMLYSVPEIIKITDPNLILQYLDEIQNLPFSDKLVENSDGGFYAKIYREIQLGVDTDDAGDLIESKESRFFRVMPFKWEGVITINGESILAPSKILNKTTELEMYNLLIPLLAQPPQLYAKTAKAICQLYDKDPEDILPDEWLSPEAMAQAQMGNQLIVGQDLAQQAAGQDAPTLTAPSNLQPNQATTSGRMSAKLGQTARI